MYYLKLFFVKTISKIYRIYTQWNYDIYKKKYDINTNFMFSGKQIKLYGEGKIILGSNSYCGDYCSFETANNCEIRIGDNVAISHNVRIYTSSRSALFITQSIEPRDKRASVRIGKNCWIGANVFINPGVTIGDNVVIGANSVVTKNIPSCSVYGGAPAKRLSSKQTVNTQSESKP